MNGTVDLEASGDVTIDDDRPYGSDTASSTVEAANGAVCEHVQERPPGTHENPLMDDEPREKRVRRGTRTLDESATREMYRTLDSLLDVDDIVEVTAGL